MLFVARLDCSQNQSVSGHLSAKTFAGTSTGRDVSFKLDLRRMYEGAHISVCGLLELLGGRSFKFGFDRKMSLRRISSYQLACYFW